MKIKDFLKGKLLTIALLIFGVITIEIFLLIYSFGGFVKIYITIIIFLGYFIGISYEYYNKSKFYSNLSNTLNELEEKYLVTEIIKEPNFIEGKILKDLLEEVDKSMLENVNKYKYLQEDYKEYIELWIHEIKLPIATSKLVIENNKNEATKSINEELDKVENYIQQALFYARSNTVEKDYYIKKSSLKDIVNESIKKNKNSLIQERIAINVHDLEVEVNTDSKWVVFILNQIIQNSVKYRNVDGNSQIEIWAKRGKENVVLFVRDNGIGIEKGEVIRVFEKGFTGSNGRLQNKKSTGIGLYLCRKLCEKLAISIEVSSVKDEGTEMKLVFPVNSYVSM